MVKNPVIIIPAFSRSESLLRLLDSVNRAVYPGKDVQLIISLDGGSSQSVREVAESFLFNHGEKTVIRREENLGLRKHILWCGDQSQKYGSVIILEDDLLVDKYFYKYASEALQFYKMNDQVAGISLYSLRFNVIAKLAFEPMVNGYSAYFIQSPSSWGQAWTSEQWSRFREWYREADEQRVNRNLNVPQTIKNWPETSWKKYFAAYMAETDRYFLYPYQSYTTNCADPGGVHMAAGTDMYQVPLAASGRPEDQCTFCTLDNSAAVYDAFLEPESQEIFRALELSSTDMEIDFYGTKPLSLLKKKNYALTPRKSSRPLQVFRYSFRPIEKTVHYPVTKPETGTFGYTDSIYLTESKHIESAKRPFYLQVNYTSYFQLENKYVFRRYLYHKITTFINRLMKPFRSKK